MLLLGLLVRFGTGVGSNHPSPTPDLVRPRRKLQRCSCAAHNRGAGSRVADPQICRHLKAHFVQVVVLSDPRLHPLLVRSFPGVVCCDSSEIPANAKLPYMATQERLAYLFGSDEQLLQGGLRPLTTPGTSRGSRCKIWNNQHASKDCRSLMINAFAPPNRSTRCSIWVDLPDKWLAFVESTNLASWLAHSEGIDPSPVGNQHAKLLGQMKRQSVSSPKAKLKQRSPFQRLIRWGPWDYRLWREIAR